MTSDKSDDKKDVGVSLQSFRGSLREFDMAVFNVLTYGSVSKAYVDSEMNTKVRLWVHPFIDVAIWG